MKQKLSEVFKKLNIKIYENFVMHEWNQNHWRSGQQLTSVEFQSVKASEDDTVFSVNLTCCVSRLFNVIIFSL